MGVDGNMLGHYSISITAGMRVTVMNLTIYFGGKRIGVTNSSGVTTAFAMDQLGSSGHFYPYGEGKGGNNPVDTWSFASYWTDSATGLNYANRRYYSNQFGRFMTPDPEANSGRANDPQSWNRYAYTRSDPVNQVDPNGTDSVPWACLNNPDGQYDPLCAPYNCSTYGFIDVTCDYTGGTGGPTNTQQSGGNGGGTTGSVWTWSLDVGYTPVVNLGSIGGNSYDHLFIWLHPTGDSNPVDGLVFDGGPSQTCNILLQCGGVTAWSSTLGHYNELTNTQAVDFFSTSLGPADNIYAGYVAGELIGDTALIQASAATDPYNPAFGPNSNSVVYSELEDFGISVPISFVNVPNLGQVGALNYPINGQAQLFTGWGQNLLP